MEIYWHLLSLFELFFISVALGGVDGIGISEIEEIIPNFSLIYFEKDNARVEYLC